VDFSFAIVFLRRGGVTQFGGWIFCRSSREWSVTIRDESQSARRGQGRRVTYGWECWSGRLGAEVGVGASTACGHSTRDQSSSGARLTLRAIVLEEVTLSAGMSRLVRMCLLHQWQTQFHHTLASV